MPDSLRALPKQSKRTSSHVLTHPRRSSTFLRHVWTACCEREQSREPYKTRRRRDNLPLDFDGAEEQLWIAAPPGGAIDEYFDRKARRFLVWPESFRARC
jgi:hypothetical protein